MADEDTTPQVGGGFEQAGGDYEDERDAGAMSDASIEKKRIGKQESNPSGKRNVIRSSAASMTEDGNDGGSHTSSSSPDRGSPRRAADSNDDSDPPSSPSRPRPSPSPPPTASRRRLPSADIPRTYSGCYGTGGTAGDLLPFELSRNRNTDWLDSGGPLLLFTYLFITLVCHACIMAIVPFRHSWTITNAAHGLVTLTYLHWIKGSPNFADDHGEMNGMTLWEQMDSNPTPHPNQRRALLIVPTVLCHAACHFAGYDKTLCLLNVTVWSICIVAKMPFMNGVRLLGINRTTGIDDDTRKQR